MKIYTTNEDGSLRLEGMTIPQGHRIYTQALAEVEAGEAEILPYVAPTPSPEQLEAEYKASRQLLVDAITVEVDGMVFDGDETSQDRMTRTALVLGDSETQMWRLTDNSVSTVTKAQFIEAIRKAGIEQTTIWFS